MAYIHASLLSSNKQFGFLFWKENLRCLTNWQVEDWLEESWAVINQVAKILQKTICRLPWAALVYQRKMLSKRGTIVKMVVAIDREE
ncbi:hypothetical protein CFP56_012694 [Quercus suber]|uniref:Uncharacterized protein n=1 Tax=Quercus suber TaxID=58331 RepID=A0AAW0KV26_QUESU